MKTTENAKSNRNKEVFIKTIVLTVICLALIVIGYLGVGYFVGYFS